MGLERQILKRSKWIVGYDLLGSRDGNGGPEKCHLSILKKLIKVAKLVGKPAVIHCGYRSPAHNAAVGGVADSAHMKGRAIDFHIPGTSHSEVARLAGTVRGVMGIGLYPWGVHIDDDPKRKELTRW